ncbi:Multifunctional CCA protein [Rosistilla carotiformis]|uniref:Multifunctional CCA protein n=1 Tax=Rosistilla carotiformis TaxID=2528017 RepID=A0A518JLS9_9BACT|nr:HD domain-containing protein [Rosistilla carotiformis]QDV66505.1 Multifunctional CCA protein [Rosistilla carotiformis]
MASPKLRHAIAWEAARLLYDHEESEYYRAKLKAARRVQKSWVKPADLPSNAEIRDQVQMMARMHEGDLGHSQRLHKMRLRALWWMRQLQAFHPYLIGSVLTGHVRDGSDIDIHVFASNPQSILMHVEETGSGCQMERKRIRKDGEERVFTHIHVRDEFPVELTVYHPSLIGHRFKSSITGKAIERATLSQLQQLIEREHGQAIDQQDHVLEEAECQVDRFQLYESLLWPLENVKQNLKYHPEGDALYHSLQVFEHARDEMPYDEDFLLAALLHDVGKAIDPQDHVAAGLEALDGFIQPRTAWLIEHHMLAHQLRDRTLGVRARRRLVEHPWHDDLVALSDADRRGRQQGVEVDDVGDALDYIRSLETMFG